ncbi:MAG: hypothetical protein DRI97_05005 [Bacteroidetes bacterium]|nr:MAG: hypothetical protein DRI97_05005 [Bacteroidota bacterium]
MKLRLRFLFGMMLIMPVLAFSQNQNCVDFETLTLGTNYGNGINAQGEVIFTQSDIPVSVEYFEWTGGGGMFGTANVMDGTSVFGTMNSMWTNNINLGFDFTGIGYVPNRVSFDYADFGGNENISVNGEPIFAGELDMAPMPPGISMVITNMGTYMKATLYGPVTKLIVGGQEFQLDNICAMLVEDTGPCVEFETLPMGQEYGNGFNLQGEVILTENGIDVSVEYFDWLGGGGTFGNCQVIDGTSYFNTGQAMWTSNINLKFDFANYTYTVNWVSFDFYDGGGEENFSLNGQPNFVGEIEDWMLPPQFTLGITDMGTYKHCVISGNAVITSFQFGGQEYAIDNICAGYVDDPGDCVDFEYLAMGATFGDGFDPMGSMIFEENDIPVFVEWFEWVGGGGTFGNCHVIDGDPTYGTGQAMWTSNINLRFEVPTYPASTWITFDYSDFGGNENIGVNGHPLFVGEISAAVLPAGFAMSITNMGAYNQATIQYSDGIITELVIGGQEFTIDNICPSRNVGVDDLYDENKKVSLGQNFPNPFSSHTVIPFGVTETTDITLIVYDQLGREVAVLADAAFGPGDYELNWDASTVTKGIYFYQLRTGTDTQTRKMLVE